tara:strand:+ start:319 stop:831 length:513 start_codon:yes stop_codon:yes gene_type:complete
MFKAPNTFNIQLSSILYLILLFCQGTSGTAIAGDDPLALTYTWTPQFYGNLKGETKLLYTNSFARCQLRFVDIDHDGDEDLYVGKADGRIAFFLNQGSIADPFFKLMTENFVVIHEGIDEQSNATHVEPYLMLEIMLLQSLLTSTLMETSTCLLALRMAIFFTTKIGVTS